MPPTRLIDVPVPGGVEKVSQITKATCSSGRSASLGSNTLQCPLCLLLVGSSDLVVYVD